MKKRNRKALRRLENAETIAAIQDSESPLWRTPRTALEAYLQIELARLHDHLIGSTRKNAWAALYKLMRHEGRDDG